MRQRRSSKRTAMFGTVLMGLACLVACGGPPAQVSMTSQTNDKEGTTKLDPMDPRNLDEDEPESSITVKASLNKQCQLGVRQLDNEEWALAEEAFRAALEESEDDERAMFGLAVALEKQEKWRQAYDWYKEVNLRHQSPAAKAGWKRVKPYLEDQSDDGR